MNAWRAKPTAPATLKSKYRRNEMAKWWETAVFYQIYPRSFQDSGADGVGDLPGIESRLDYLAALGVDALWISPFYPSPMKDFGYDISDYRNVHPMFGTMADFDRLLGEAHRRGIRIIVDLVINHSSDQHPWFVEARSSRDNPKHDWYIWKPMRRDRFGRLRKPNNWVAQFELASAWWPNEATGEWYLGTFTRNQPEFNWRNPELRAEMYDLIRWWLDKGVDGFRMDVVNWFIKDRDFRSNPRNLVANPDIFQDHLYDRNQPEVHEICREIRRISDGYSGDRVLVGEVFCRDPAQAASYLGADLDELHMAFNIDLMYKPWSAAELRGSIRRLYDALPSGAWPNATLSNHDQPRHSFRFKAKTEEETDRRMKTAAAFLLTLRGTPFIYYGEEIGMRQSVIARKDLRDPLGIKTWPLRFLGRDGERTPMQWSADANAGFSDGAPWLPLHPDNSARNVASQEEDPNSLLAWYRALIALRRSSPALRSGAIRFIDDDHADLIAYERAAEGDRVLVALNLSGRTLRFAPESAIARLFVGARVLLGSRLRPETPAADPSAGLELGPSEVLIARG
jgi:alpha-glucosidase